MTHLGDLISALIDGELGGLELDRANAHLAACAACRDDAAQLREVKRQLRTLCDLDGADAMTGRLLAMAGPDGRCAPGARSGFGAAVTARPLNRQPGRRARRRRGRYAMWGAMSLVVVGVGAAAFGMGGGSSAGNEPQITPQLELFDQQHALTSGDVPFVDPVTAQADGLAQTTVNVPANALMLRLAAEDSRP